MKRIIVVLMALLLCVGLAEAVAGTFIRGTTLELKADGTHVLVVHTGLFAYGSTSETTISYKVLSSTGDVVGEGTVIMEKVMHDCIKYVGRGGCYIDLPIPRGLLPGNYTLECRFTGTYWYGRKVEQYTFQDKTTFTVGIFIQDAYISISSGKFIIRGENFGATKGLATFHADACCKGTRARITSWSDTRIEENAKLKGACEKGKSVGTVYVKVHRPLGMSIPSYLLYSYASVELRD